MMNRKEFLLALQTRIAVLEESEQQDILAEYAQHIEMRMAGGLTEEEAIRDFGDLNQLAAEILGAYHIKADYQTQPTGLTAAEKCREGLNACGGFLSRVWHRFTGICARVWDAIAGFFLASGNRVRALFHRPPRERQKQQGQRTILPAVKSGSHKAIGWLGRFCREALRLFWNLILALCALPLVFLALLGFLCLGALVVLLFQGYPLVGVSVCCLGALLCCVSILGLGWSLIRHSSGKEEGDL